MRHGRWCGNVLCRVDLKDEGENEARRFEFISAPGCVSAEPSLAAAAELVWEMLQRIVVSTNMTSV